MNRNSIAAQLVALLGCGVASAAGVDAGWIPPAWLTPLIVAAGVLIGLNKLVEAVRIVIDWRKTARAMWQQAVKEAVAEATKPQVTATNQLIDGYNGLYCVRSNGLCDGEGAMAPAKPTPIPRIAETGT